MLGVTIDVDVRPALRTLEGHRSQVRFATAQALTRTAQAGQRGVQRQAQRVFATTRVWWLKQQPTGIRIKGANRNTLTAWVKSGPGAFWAERQEEGGGKRARSSRRIAIPTYRKAGRKPLKAGGFGGAQRRWRSRGQGTSAFDAAWSIVARTTQERKGAQMRVRYNKRTGKPSTVKYPVAWIADSKKVPGQKLLFMKTRKSAKPSLEFVLDPAVQVRPRFGFEAVVVREARRTFARNFQLAAIRAVRTAR